MHMRLGLVPGAGAVGAGRPAGGLPLAPNGMAGVVSPLMKCWLDQEIEKAGKRSQDSPDPYVQVQAAARIVALAQVRAEVWKLS